MKIVITGCSGSVGTAIVECALKEGHSVLGLDLLEPKDLNIEQDAFDFQKCDLTDYDAVLAAFQGCEALYAV